MTQLWLNGQRIDSIPLLRSFLRTCDEEARKQAIRELIRKYQAGKLSKWVARQREAMPASSLAAALDPKQSKLHLLVQNRFQTVQEALPFLAELCTEDEELQRQYAFFFAAQLEDMPMDSESLLEEKKQRIMAQPWYQEEHRLFEHIDWTRAAIDTDEAEAILSLLSMEQPKVQATIYLCKIENGIFCIKRPLDLKNVRLVGCGKPRIHFSAHYRGKKLDMNENNLIFERLTIDTQGLKLTNTNGRLKQVTEE